MSDREGSTGDEDDDEEGAAERKKAVPDWARGPTLEAAIHAQYGGGELGGPMVDPDRIFAEVTTCDLEEVFPKAQKKKGSRFTKRTSSGNWAPDALTHNERAQYRRDMRYAEGDAAAPK
jgi:predicted HAD superfamily Cof-like phosphohydrolase